MILNKQSNVSARWDHDNNKWWIGNVDTYQWVTVDNKSVSDWMDFDTALIWIKKHDERI